MTTIISHKEWIEIFPEAKEYLEEDLTYQLKKFDLLKEIYKNQLDIFDLKEKIGKLPSEDKWFGIMIADIFIGEEIKKTEKIIKEIDRYLREPSKGDITQDDIEAAKEYPFKNLIKLNKSGFALCPFHKDTHPSFYIKNNWGYCFSCGKSVDTIQFIIETEGLTFIQAVNLLK